MQTEKYKVISHVDRLNKSKSVKLQPRTPLVQYISEEVIDEKTKRVRLKTKKIISKKNPYYALRASDFALENILKVKDVKDLKSCSLVHDNSTIISKLEQSISNIDSNINNDK